METRFPFRYGIAAMTAAPHVFLRGEFEIAGKRAIGFSSEGLPPKWFTKSPGTPFSEDLPQMLDVIAGAVERAGASGEGASLFDWWRALYAAQDTGTARHGVPPLLAHLGTSLVERAGIDAFCRAAGVPFAEAIRQNLFGVRLGEIHSELGGFAPGDLIQQGRVADPTLFARHTIGLADPLADAEIADADRVEDGLPQSLEACIGEYGLRYFKIKLCGDFDRDAGRLRDLAGILGTIGPDCRFTLDGNEQYRTLADFRDHWERHREDSAVREFLSGPRLVFVEQPVHRDEALAPHVGADLAAWSDAPPLIIDESDGSLDAARRALELGYAGTSHKNCKGVLKGLANACLMNKRSADTGRPLILSGEDLANVGPVALLQDLAAMHAFGVGHVERNGHHYFRGLGMFGPAMNHRVLDRHGDLYHRQAGGFATVTIREGKIDLGSVIAAPFGTAFRVDELLEPWLPLAEWRARGAFDGF
ncbi:MAG: hypothetical protein KDM91_04980 [Verrucomicrobiae bacterium]|nr:hypothetical protein [Verrucomicrobiae bacterium]